MGKNAIFGKNVMRFLLLCLPCILFVHAVTWINARPAADFVPEKETNATNRNNTTTTPCKTKDGTVVKCGPCEHCSIVGKGCVSICAECEECQAGVCVFSKPGYCYGPSFSKCYRAGEFFHRQGMCCILSLVTMPKFKILCTLS